MTVDLHLNPNFLIRFYMIHSRDVIKISCKEVGQKAKSNLFSNLENVFHFLDSFPANYHKNKCFVCNGFSKILSDSQEITHKSKSLVQPFRRSSWEKVPKTSQMNLLTIANVSFTIFILFIISVITWFNVYENLPIDLWNFFCELIVYVTCVTRRVIPQIKATKILISKISVSSHTYSSIGSSDIKSH